MAERTRATLEAMATGEGTKSVTVPAGTYQVTGASTKISNKEELTSFVKG